MFPLTFQVVILFCQVLDFGLQNIDFLNLSLTAFGRGQAVTFSFALQLLTFLQVWSQKDQPLAWLEHK